MDNFDTIIIGGGSAGCTLAGRLSADATKSVLLIEAGVDTPPGAEPQSIRDSYPVSHGDPEFSWPDLTAEIGVRRADGGPGFSGRYQQARVMGGGSSIMGMVGLRGVPTDYDEWRALGAEGWGWDDVLPFFKKLEHDLDFNGPMHGQDGPVPIRRNQPEAWGGFSRAVSEIWKSRGYKFIPDNNADFGEGFAPVPMSNFPDRRVSSAMAYLTEAVRKRSNLRILTNAQATQLTRESARITGVEVNVGSTLRRFTARETIVSAGAIHSPALLMRSGIGPGADLQRLGIDVIADLPAVGRNLHNHPVIYITSYLPRAAAQPKHVHTWGQVSLRYSSRYANCPGSDMSLTVVSKTSWHPLGRRAAAISVSVNKSFSRGEMTLQSADPRQEPLVNFRTLSDERDFARMVDGLMLCFGTLADPKLDGVRNEVFAPNASLVQRLNRPLWSSWATSLAISTMFDLVPVLRRKALTMPRAAMDPILLSKDRDAVQALVRTRVASSLHGVGTCRMGRADDPDAVLDPACRVRKVTGLRVVDGSVMPSMVSGNTNLPIIMIAEKIAAQILAEKTP